MHRKLIIIVLIIGIIFISGCTTKEEPFKEVDIKEEFTVNDMKFIVYESISDYFPEFSNSFSFSDYKYEFSDERCGSQWFYEVYEDEMPYPRIQVCDNGNMYTLDELYIAYQETSQNYNQDEYFQDSSFEVKREELTNGDIISFEIKNQELCENGITIRFPCQKEYVIELLMTYSCNDDLAGSNIRKVANEILRYC